MSPRLLHSFRPALLIGAAALLSAVACAGSTAPTAGVTHPTMIEVAPESFIGSVPCATGEAAGLRRYVATLFDINQVAGEGGAASSDGAGGQPEEFQLPSSVPSPCRAAVGFAFVLSARYYRVEIDGYDTDDLSPRALGARQMVAAAKPEPTTPLAVPRWHATCEATMAVDSTIVRATRCTTFAPVDPAANGSVRIDLSSLRGELKCGTAAGEVDHFDVATTIAAASGADMPEVRNLSVPCADGTALLSDVPTGRRVSAYVTAVSTAHAASETPFAGTSCNATSVAEATVDAECSGLSQVGTLRVDLPAALAQLGVSCSAESVSSVSLDVPMQEKPTLVLPPTCRLPFDQGFAPGPAVITVTPLSPTGDELGALQCSGDVTPGQLVTATCEPK